MNASIHTIHSKFHFSEIKRYFGSVQPSGQQMKMKKNGGVLVVMLDSPNEEVNSLTSEKTIEMLQIIQQVETNPAITSVVITSSKPGCFVAGADISMLEKCKTASETAKIVEDAHNLLDRIEQSKKPIVAAINGICLGGGLELALACHYRIALKDKKTIFGFPEVLLGLLPGAGGTQRCPKLTSVATALTLQLTGKTVKADKAKKMGLVDLLVYPLGPGLKPAQQNTMEYLEEIAIKTARDLASGQLKV